MRWCAYCLLVDLFMCSIFTFRFSFFVFHFSLFTLHFFVVLEKNPPRRREIIIKLPVPDTPEEGHQEASCDKNADEKKKDDCTHFVWVVSCELPLLCLVAERSRSITFHFSFAPCSLLLAPCPLLFDSLYFFAINSLNPYVIRIIDIELQGISIAAIIGDRVPWTAKYKPMIL